MDLDPETMARFLGAICRQAIRDFRDGWHEPGYLDVAEFFWEAGLLHTDGAVVPLIARCRQDRSPGSCAHAAHAGRANDEPIQPTGRPARKPNDRRHDRQPFHTLPPSPNSTHTLAAAEPSSGLVPPIVIRTEAKSTGAPRRRAHAPLPHHPV